MEHSPEINRDVDALFEHLTRQGHQMSDVKDWRFTFRSEDLAKLQTLAGPLAEEFDIDLLKDVEEFEPDGARVLGPPLLSVMVLDALAPERVKAIHERMADLAEREGLFYEGVACFEPIDMDELFHWLSLKEAIERLKQYGESGMPRDAELPWVFLVVTDEFEQAQAIAEDLSERDLGDIDLYDEPDEDGHYGLCAFMTGRNNKSELTETYKKFENIATFGDGKLEGVQFISQDDLYGEEDV